MISVEYATQTPVAPLRKPRWLAHLLALLGGYFWLPCEACGRYFAGQEADSNCDVKGPRIAGRRMGVIVCSPRCVMVGEAMRDAGLLKIGDGQ